MGNTTIFTTIFEGLEKGGLELLRQVTHTVDYPAGAVLCREGEIEHTFYVVVKGQVAVTRTRPDGTEQLLSIVTDNGYFGEMALLDNQPRIATCTAVTPTQVLEITEKAFDKLLEKSPAVAYGITRRVLANLRSLDRQAFEDLEAKNIALQEAYDDLRQAQAALVEKERLERELEIAADVQRSLIPEALPVYPDYEFAAYLQPARYVGGDFYDVIPLDGEHFGLLMADVVDKSVHAALFMAVTSTLFRTACRQSLSPATVALNVHRGMLDASTAEMFVTAFYGVLHRPSGRLTYVMAGQERPLFVQAGQPVTPLAGGGRFLGIIEPLELQEYTVNLQAGDRLLLFSDGVPDATDPQGERYGYERLHALVDGERQCPLADLVQRLAADLRSWGAGAAPFDDITLLALEKRPEIVGKNRLGY